MAMDTPATQNMVKRAVGKDLNIIVVKDVEVNAIPCTGFLTGFQRAHTRVSQPLCSIICRGWCFERLAKEIWFMTKLLIIMELDIPTDKENEARILKILSVASV